MAAITRSERGSIERQGVARAFARVHFYGNIDNGAGFG
jgi:hypothetical protein